MAASSWARILEEFGAEEKIKSHKAPWARVLQRKVNRLVDVTARPLVIYGSACTAPGKQGNPQVLQIDPSDKLPFRDVTERLKGPKLDVLIHSPGGFVEASEGIVELLRRKFDNIRFIVPAYAKSAATIMVMSGNEIWMDDDAELGPIDPQMHTPNGIVPAEAIKEQFRKATEDITADPKKVAIWLPILQPMGPGLLVQCDNAIELSKRLVCEWLVKYMFGGEADAEGKAKAVAEYLSSHSGFKSHARRVSLDDLKRPEFGLRVSGLNKSDDLRTRVWDVYCTMDIIFSNTPIYKLFYNSSEDAIIRQESAVQLVMDPPLPAPQPAPLPKP